MQSILIISHGSRSPKTKVEVQKLADQIKAKTQIDIVECAWLEIESPNINEGIDLCVNQGAKEVIVLLNFLNSGRHVNEDIPEIISESRKKHSNVKIKISQPVGQHERIVDLFLDLLVDTATNA